MGVKVYQKILEDARKLILYSTEESSWGGWWVSDWDKWDITVSWSWATWTINANVVDYNKLATSVQDSLDLADTALQPWNVKNSIEVDAWDLQLVWDELSPGNDKVYGTDWSGNKWWKDDPNSQTIVINETYGRFTYAANSKYTFGFEFGSTATEAQKRIPVPAWYNLNGIVIKWWHWWTTPTSESISTKIFKDWVDAWALSSFSWGSTSGYVILNANVDFATAWEFTLELTFPTYSTAPTNTYMAICFYLNSL